MESFDNIVKNYTTWLDNPYVSGALIVFLIVYASMAAPRLPMYVAKLFDYTLVKLLMFFLIVYVSKKNATVALVAAVALMVSIMALDKLKLSESMSSVSSVGSDSCNCDCNCDMMKLVKSEESRIVLSEAKRAEEQGALSSEEKKLLAEKLAKAEAEGKPVLVARTEEGAKKMEEIAKAESEGKLSSEDALRMAASVVIREAIIEANVSTNNNNIQSAEVERTQNIVMPPSGNSVENLADVNSTEQEQLPVNLGRAEESRLIGKASNSEQETKSMQELAQEVLKIKDLVAEKRGAPVTPEELKLLCANVLDNYKNSKGSMLAQQVEEVVPSDSSDSSYASF